MKKIGLMMIVALMLAAAGCARQEAALLTWQRAGDRWEAHRDMETYTLEADIPAVSDAIDEANKARAEDMARSFSLEMAQRLEELPKTEGTGAWVLKGEASGLDDRFTSVALVQYTYLPGNAHGAYAIETRTYQAGCAEPVALSSLFVPGTDIYRELSRIAYWMLLDSDQLGDYADPQWISSGTEPTEENFSAFMVRPEGLEIIFAPYQIGPWALGEQRLTIPWSRLAQWLTPELAEVAGVAEGAA